MARAPKSGNSEGARAARAAANPPTDADGNVAGVAPGATEATAVQQNAEASSGAQNATQSAYGRLWQRSPRPPEPGFRTNSTGGECPAKSMWRRRKRRPASS